MIIIFITYTFVWQRSMFLAYFHKDIQMLDDEIVIGLIIGAGVIILGVLSFDWG